MAKKYSCKNCGAELYFDPKRGKLHCEYCDTDYDPSEYDFTPEEENAKDTVIPQSSDTDADELQNAKAGEGSQATDDSMTNQDLVVYQCPNCGAEVITSKKTVATTCVYCNQAITLSGNVKGVFKPDYVLPFQVERNQVEEAYRNLCRRSWLTPKLFLKDSTIEKIKGLYVPFWLYSFDGQIDLTMRAERTRIFQMGNDEITEISSYDVRESGIATFDQIPADAMKDLDNVLMDSVAPYDFSKMVPFNPAYLAGFYTQQWDDSVEDNEPRAKERAKKTLNAMAKEHAGQFTTTIVENERYTWPRQSSEYALLPVWMMYTEYHGKKYMFGMNGQNGKIVGEIPKDYGKLVRVAGLAFVISQIILMIIRILGVML